jgi:hypothetical protein
VAGHPWPLGALEARGELFPGVRLLLVFELHGVGTTEMDALFFVPSAASAVREVPGDA